MKKGRNDVAFVVDPDVDRLAIICENGSMYGEEYTLVTVADYVLKHTPGNTVSNLALLVRCAMLLANMVWNTMHLQ